MSLRLAVLTAAMIPIAATIATAQLSPPPPTYVVFGGAAIPKGDASDRLDRGYTVGAGVDFYAIPNNAPVGLRLEGSYANFGARTPSTALTSTAASELAVNVNAVIWNSPDRSSLLSPYITFGPTYARVHQMVRSDGVLLSDTTSNHFLGLNAGGGIDIRFGAFAVRLDARYRRSMNSSIQTFPLTVGIRF